MKNTSTMRIEADIRPSMEHLRLKSGVRSYTVLLSRLVSFVLNDKDILDKFIKLQEDILLARTA
jgi:hypothetical protein